ncbi:MAG: helix-hairpin-helix domain-containing protein [Planctomycetota bacterium]
MPNDLQTIPGIGRTFVKDFGRIGVTEIAQLRRRDPEALFAELVAANDREIHPTSKNYLYVIRMAVYYANGGRDPDKLKWSAWKDCQ